MKNLKITWNGHSCFTVEKDGFKVVFDPYKAGEVPGYKPLDVEADLVLCSHGHDDHNADYAVKLTDGHVNPFTVGCVDTYHDPEKGRLRGTNKIYYIESEGMKLVHLGDVGCRLEDEELAALKGADVVLIPVGGFFTIDAAEAAELAERLGAKVIIPMHFKGDGFGYEPIGPVEAFTALRKDVVKAEGSSFEYTPETAAQTLVLKPVFI